MTSRRIRGELPLAPEDKEKDRNSGNSGENGLPPGIDPIILGLLARLPKAGEVWPEAQRDLWVELLKGSFKLIYKDEVK